MAETQELTTAQKVAKLSAEGAETLEALLSTKTLTEAASQLKLTRNAVYARIDKHGLTEIVQELKHKAVLSLAQSSVDAAENLANKLSSSDDKASILASTEILDRAGIVKPQTGDGGLSITFNTLVQQQRERFKV